MASKDMNQLSLVGRLTRDAELAYRASGMALCKFSIAVNRRILKDDEWKDEPNFFDLVLFGQEGERQHRSLVKGQQVAIEAEVKQERWEKDGKTQSKVGFHVNNVQLLGPRPVATTTEAPPAATPPPAGDGSGDLPFEDDNSR